ncbi:MAG: hypothetical protein L6R36_000144 [Xanthoria steineri]|nr:MAG: hypothetical protein L6R36_000144 [Xanthoria steineri]
MIEAVGLGPRGFRRKTNTRKRPDQFEAKPEKQRQKRPEIRRLQRSHSPTGIGGAVWHGVKGFRNSPYGERRIGAITAIKARAPVLGGNFGVWGGLFSTFDCAVKGVRKKEDPYNAIIAGFFTGGSLAIRGGMKAARNSAIGCAILLAVIEGVGIGIQRMMAENTRLDVAPPPPPPPAAEGSQSPMLA